MKPIRVNAFFIPVLIIAALLGSYGIAEIAGVWQTSGRGEVMLDASGQPDPEGIKGWMTIGGVADTYGVPLEALYAMLGTGPGITADTELKDLEGLLPGMDVATVRSGVAAYLDGSWTAADGPYGGGEQVPAATPSPNGLPAETAVPAALPTAGPATPSATSEHTPQGSGDGEGVTLPTDGGRLAAVDIKGRMTLQEVMDYCQVPLEYLAAELKLPPDVNTRTLLRDMVTQYGVDIMAVRDVVGKYQAEH